MCISYTFRVQENVYTIHQYRYSKKMITMIFTNVRTTTVEVRNVSDGMLL